MDLKNLKIKIVALWFFLLGTLSILAIFAIGYAVYAYISALNILRDLGAEPFGLPAIISLLSLLFNIPLLAFLSYILFKIRLSLYKFEKDGYSAALIFFIVTEVSLILSIPLQLLYPQKFELWNVAISIIIFILNLLFINFLFAEKKYFTINKTSQKGLSRKIIIVLILSLLNIPLLYVSQKSFEWQEKSQQKKAQKELEQFYQKYENIDPAVSSWKLYSNSELHFKIEIPSNFYVKTSTYSLPGYTPPREIKRVWFSDKELPAEPTSDDIYFEIEIYPKIAEENMSFRGYYLEDLQSDDTVEKIQLKNIIGYRDPSSLDSIKFGYKDYIYELEPKAKNPMKNKLLYTDISNRMLKSIEVTD